MRTRRLLLSLACVLPCSAEDVPEGHSLHGEAFNEGPRQETHLMGDTGAVHLPIATKSPEAQAFFDQGLGQLYGFWTLEAERSFRKVHALDPDCAMAYWGLAMATLGDDERAEEFIAEAVERRSQADDRGRRHIDGLNGYLTSKRSRKAKSQEYIEDLEDILHEYPDDVETKAMLAWRLWDFKGSLGITSYQAVDALLDQVFDANPQHPAHHFRIHLWDGKKPERALASAARCGQSAPNIAHMWHMPGHIYSKLHRYEDAVWQQEASSRTDHRHMMADMVLPDQISNYAHNQEWMTRNLLKIGRVEDALAIATNLLSLPRHPKYNTADRRGSSASYGRDRLADVLRDYELWEEVVRLADTPLLDAEDGDSRELSRLRLLAAAHHGLGDASGLADVLAEMEQRRDAAAAEHDAAERKRLAEEEPEPLTDWQRSLVDLVADKAGVEAKRPAAGKARPYRSKSLDGAIAEVRGYRDLLAGTFAAERSGEKKPLSCFGSLPMEAQARLALAAGMPDDALKLAEKAVGKAEDEVLPLAALAFVQERTGHGGDAIETFKRLRALSSSIDSLDYRPLRRVAQVAAMAGHAGDWRVVPTVVDDVGDRPELATLGPLRWQPVAAPEWSLPDSTGQRLSLTEYRGKPVVVIFYLGHGCLHCAEQLQKFAPRTRDFRDAGIEVVGISTDTTEEVAADLASSGDALGGFAFPLLADPELNVFRQYRCHDDFEKRPLHGTFLIDGTGQVRWQDIGHEPFTDPQFLLDEAKRLLKLPDAGGALAQQSG